VADRQTNLDSLIRADALALDVDIKTPENPEDRQSRLRRLEADATHARWREDLKFAGFYLLILSFVIGSAYFAIKAGKDDTELRQWCLATLTMVISGGLGYMVGEKVSKAGK
jgi:hypothetical protein